MTGRISPFLGLLLVLFLPLTVAADRSQDLDSWISGDLVPYVRDKLTAHPRFRGQTIQFVMLGGDEVLAAGNALALGISDRLRDALSIEPGVRILRQPGLSGPGLAPDRFDCAARAADYLVGVGIETLSPGTVEVKVRALDRVDNSWVTGFSRRWQGRLSRDQFRDSRTLATDAAFRGQRLAPWSDAETDLMAEQLALEIGCGLSRQTDGEYLLDAPAGQDAAGQRLIELVANNLAAITYFQFAAEGHSANARITGKAHRVDDDLYQYWITVVPQGSDSELAVVSADAYIRVSDRGINALALPEETAELETTPQPFLAGLNVVRLPGRSACGRGAYPDPYRTGGYSQHVTGNHACFALEVDSRADAIAFFLNHQLNHGLVRLSAGNCDRQGHTRVLRSDESLRHPLPNLSVGSWLRADSWSLEPRSDTYFVLASKDTRAARALAAHMEALPGRCGDSLRAGLEGPELRKWIAELGRIVKHWSQSIDWRAVSVSEIY